MTLSDAADAHSAAPFGFAGEQYLITPPPDYPAEWKALTNYALCCIAFFVVGVPVLVVPALFGRRERKGSVASDAVSRGGGSSGGVGTGAGEKGGSVFASGENAGSSRFGGGGISDGGG